jgi:hypothetical protein
MKNNVTTIVRLIAGITLLVVSVRFASGTHGFERILGVVEAVAAAAFCLPRVWRAGAIGLLLVFAVAIAHHALQRQFPLPLIFYALVVILELVHERP